MPANNRTIAAMLTAGALGDQFHTLSDDHAREETSRWIVASYRAILRELDATEPEDEEKGRLGFSIR